MSAIANLLAKHDIPVSRETADKLQTYDTLLHKWQKTINLVSSSTLNETAERHFLDSAQLLRHLPDKVARLADLGSGAGFPGLVLAILGMTDVHLVESDIRKATFLREVSRETKTPLTVHDCRIEDCMLTGVEIVTARALAPLVDLLGHVERLAFNGTGLFLKGAKHEEEIAKAKKIFDFQLESFASLADAEGKVLKVTQVSRIDR